MQCKHNFALSPFAVFQTFDESNLPLVSVTTWLSVTVFLFILRLTYFTCSFKKQAVFQRINQGCQVQYVHLSWTWFHVRCIALFLLAVVDMGDGHGWLLPSSFHPPCPLMFSSKLLWFSLVLLRFGKEGRRGHRGLLQSSFPTWSLSRHFYSFVNLLRISFLEIPLCELTLSDLSLYFSATCDYLLQSSTIKCEVSFSHRVQFDFLSVLPTKESICMMCQKYTTTVGRLSFIVNLTLFRIT